MTHRTPEPEPLRYETLENLHPVLPPMAMRRIWWPDPAHWILRGADIAESKNAIAIQKLELEAYSKVVQFEVKTSLELLDKIQQISAQ